MRIKVFLTSVILLIGSTPMGFAQEPTPQWRPAYHFTPEKNWTNDPNGLFYLNGKFQLYYQHNPFENKWGHMSWGHAESADLVHWRHLPVAIPEVLAKDTTTWIYSGSAVWDKNNTSGFGKDGKPPVIAIFTADQPKQQKESQFIAYSNDGGMTFSLYPNNPVIDLQMRDFRDPNVFWFEPTQQWVMTVAMVNEHLVRFYGSKDLKQWTKLSDFGPAGYTRNGWECPSLIPLPVDGNPSNIKYVLLVSCGGDHGPLMQYYIGDFDGTIFTNSNPNDLVLKVDNGDAFYAAIAWRDAPENKKILLGWLQNGHPETFPWKGQMSIPRDLSLKTTSEGIRLFQTPSAIITDNLPHLAKGSPLIKKNVRLKGKMSLSDNTASFNNAYWMDVELKPDALGKTGFWIAEKQDHSKKVEIGYDAAKKELYVDCTTAEGNHKDSRNLLQTTPLELKDGIVKLQILVDRSSLEVFGNDGRQVISTMIYPDEDATLLSAFSSGNATIRNLKIFHL